jgi:rhodanese-related sulfurtransferase
VDDEPRVARLARDYLEKNGFRVLTAADGQSALTVARREKPDLVILDLMLPNIDGRETIWISLGHDTSASDIRYKTMVVEDYIEGRISFVNMLAPAQLNENILSDKNTFILDVRPPDGRKRQKGLPNSHEVNPLHVENYLKQLPREKQILVYCPGGGLSVMISYYLKAKSFKRVTNLRGGLDGWRKRCSDLYKKYAGQNVTVLQPDSEISS